MVPGTCDELFSAYRVYAFPSFLPSVLIFADLFSFVFLVGASFYVALPWLDNPAVRWLRLTRRGKTGAGDAWHFSLFKVTLFIS